MSQNPAPAAPLVRRFSRNTQGRDLIVGDVHGCFDKLAAALADAGFDPDAGDRLFSVGDLVDRGPQSESALEWLAAPWFFAVAGNHEDMAVSFLDGACPAGMYAMNGGSWLIGKTTAERLPFADAFGALPLAIELETAAGLVILVHADVPGATWAEVRARLGCPDDAAASTAAALLWSRSRIQRGIDVPVSDVRAVVVGHTPVELPVVLGNVHHIDTGGWIAGGKTSRRFTVLDAATLETACRLGATLADAGQNPA